MNVQTNGVINKSLLMVSYRILKRTTVSMNDKKAAKKLLKIAKEHPDWYSKKDIFYAKMIKKQLKLEKKHNEREINNSDPQSGTAHGLRGTSEQSQEPRQPKRGWFAKLLHKARSLVSF
tara:strand:+ start:689 stop:1045 length:357 start_codon:yes stop_codon:yes gene_type:complete